MSKLWIVHRSPQVRAALLRATGLAAAETASGAPTSADFSSAAVPAAIVLALSTGCEAELEFALRVGPRVRAARWILLCDAGAKPEVRRIFRAYDPVLLDYPPDPRVLRTEISAALALRTTPSLAQRRSDARIAERFDAWFGATSVPGLEHALDPALAALPLLLRGRPGSGRSLLGLHAECTRGGAAPILRIDARDLADIDALARRIASARDSAGAPGRTLWLDEVDALSFTAQRGLAEWIRHESPPGRDASGIPSAPLRWIATAGPGGLEDRLEPVLLQAFAPLVVSVPPLDPRRGELARIAEYTAREWAQRIIGPPRAFAPGALEALAEEPWWGGRAEVEAVLRSTLASTRRNPIEASDLRFPGEPDAASPSTAPRLAPDEPGPFRRPASFGTLPTDPALDPSAELTTLSERWIAEQPPVATSATGVPSRQRPQGTRPEAATPGADPSWRKLARSLSHEIRNPLVSIRTFTELLSEHYADATFRARFKELVGKDVAHIQDVVSLLSKAAERDRLVSGPVDVSALIDRLLAARRDRIGQSRLVVLTELERDAPQALADLDALETALTGLVDRALDSLPERGDLFMATHRLTRSGDGRPRLRVLLRHRNPQAEGMGGELDPVHHILEYVLAETIIAALGGRLTIDPTQGPDTLIVIDLPTPEPTPEATGEATREPTPGPP